jgi:hypothetical protein
LEDVVFLVSLVKLKSVGHVGLFSRNPLTD